MEAEADSPIPREGLSLAALRAFAAEHTGRRYTVDRDGAPTVLRFEELTTADVVQCVVKPATLDAAGGEACTYAQLLQARGAADDASSHAPLVGQATAFVSHAWSYVFFDLLAALEAHARASRLPETTFFWVDIFVCFQHKAAKLSQEWWSRTFRRCVVDIGFTILVLSPWHAPAPLTRSWCVWELHSTIDGGARLEVALSPSQSAAFKQALTARFGEIAKAMGNIDARRAQAFLPADRLMIAAAVRASAGGFEAVNARIHERLRRWLAEEAAALLRERRAALGSLHVDTLSAMFVLALLLKGLGRQDEAEPLHREALAGRTATLGAAHPDTVSSTLNLAILLKDRGKLAEAEPLYREALRLRLDSLGREHPDTLSAMTNLANILRSRGAYDDAEALYVDALRLRRKVLGDTHPSTLASIHNLAILRAFQGEPRLEEGQALFREALRSYRLELGPKHIDTLECMGNMASLLRARGERAEAAALFAEALACQREIHGDAHPSTVATLSKYASLLADEGRAEEAERMYRQALQLRRDTLGDAHPDTQASMTNLAALLATQKHGQREACEEAESLFRAALALQRAALGDAHPRTRVTRDGLAALLAAQGRDAEVAALQQDNVPLSALSADQ